MRHIPAALAAALTASLLIVSAPVASADTMSAPQITSPTAATFEASQGGTFEVTTTGDPIPSLSGYGLPPGSTFVDHGNGATFTVPPEPNIPILSYSVGISATNSSGTTRQTLEVALVGEVLNNVEPLRTGQGAQILVNNGGDPAPTTSETGTLPIGMSFQRDVNGDAEITGTPTTPGDWPITVVVTNSDGQFSISVDLDVEEYVQSHLTSDDAATFTVNEPGSFEVKASGVPTPSLSELGTLPPGLAFTSGPKGTAIVSGTASVAGTYQVMVAALNVSTGFPLTITVLPPPPPDTIVSSRLGAVQWTTSRLGKVVLRTGNTYVTRVMVVTTTHRTDAPYVTTEVGTTFTGLVDPGELAWAKRRHERIYARNALSEIVPATARHETIGAGRFLRD